MLRRATTAASLLWILVLSGSAVDAARKAWVSDDIFITFRYCDQWLAGHGPVYNPGERVEGYTHFLWFLLLTLGRAAGIAADALGKYGAIPFYAGSLLLLVAISARLFPRRGGIWGIPVAALGWGVHEDARLFASGGLETSAFTCAVLAGFGFLAAWRPRRRASLAAWVFAIAWLLRPEALLYTVLAGIYLAWRPARPGEARTFAWTWLVLVLPHFVFRLLYYGDLLPNPYYAKSGGAAYWSQGWVYTWTYFAAYFVLIGAPLAALPLWRALRRPAVAEPLRAAAPGLAWALAASLLTVVYVNRVGGDFMFARFFLPVTPWLLLLVEYGVHHLSRPWARATAGCAVVLLLGLGGMLKERVLAAQPRADWIVDEHTYYSREYLGRAQDQGERFGACLESTSAVVMVQGGQSMLAYYARFPIAMDLFGLTDAHVAHQPLESRARPGHEKSPTAGYVLYERKVNFLTHIDAARRRWIPDYRLFSIPNVIQGEIYVYDRGLMQHLGRCPDIRFFDFPRWLEREYIPAIGARDKKMLRSEWEDFHRFYFDHNDDPEGLRDRLRQALAAAGITDLIRAPRPR